MTEPDGPTSLAITVVGRDRPGIIAETATALAGCGMNLEDSSMTLLRGHFAMTLICAGESDAVLVRESLGALADDGSLTVDVRTIDEQAVPDEAGESYLITVHGADRLGIVARLTAVVAEAGGNIIDLTTRLSPRLYVLAAEVELPSTADPDGLRARLADAAADLGVEVSMRPAERDEL